VQFQLPNTINKSLDAFILVDANGIPIDFMLSGSFYNRASTATVYKIDASVTNGVILPANTSRKGRPSVYYDGAAIMYVLLGPGTASATNYTIKLGAGLLNYYEPPMDNYIGVMSAVFSAVAGSAFVTEAW